MCSNKSAVSTYHEEGSGARSFGYLIIAGPIYGQERACLSGQRCTLRNMEGYGLTERNSIVVLSSGECGDWNALVVTSTWEAVSPSPGSQSSGSQSEYSLGTPRSGIPGPQYKLCCQPPQPTPF